MPSFDGRAIIVTGAGSGLGDAIARRLHDDGASVLLTDVNTEAIESTAATLGERAAAFTHDVTKADQWEGAVAACKEAFGGVYGLVNNAGIVALGLAMDQTEEDFRRVVDVNQVGPFLGMKAVIPAIAESGGGAVVNIASIDGHVGTPGISPYVGTKHAVLGLTKSIAAEVAPMGVRVNAVSPGGMYTNIFDQPGLDLSDMAEHLNKTIPLGHISDPAEVAPAVAFMLSDDAGYVTGSDIVVDGGLICSHTLLPTAG